VITGYGTGGIASHDDGFTLPLTAEARARIVRELVKYAEKISADGLCVGLDKPGSGQRYSYLEFLSELASTLHAKEKVLYVCLPADLQRPEYRRISETADMSIVMAFRLGLRR
jgi:spore germination protein YaaH